MIFSFFYDLEKYSTFVKEILSPKNLDLISHIEPKHIETEAILFSLVYFLCQTSINLVFCKTAVIFKHCALFYILFLKCHVNVYKTKQFLLCVWCSDFFYLKKTCNYSHNQNGKSSLFRF